MVCLKLFALTISVCEIFTEDLEKRSEIAEFLTITRQTKLILQYIQFLSVDNGQGSLFFNEKDTNKEDSGQCL